MKIEISLHEGKNLVNKLSSAIADLELGDAMEALQQLKDLELWLSGKFVLIDKPETELGYD